MGQCSVRRGPLAKDVYLPGAKATGIICSSRTTSNRPRFPRTIAKVIIAAP